MNRLLVTGGAGFIGTNFVKYWLEQYPGDRLVVLDVLTYAGCRANLAEELKRPQLRFVRGDIGDRALVDTLLRTESLNGVVHFAAESHVDRSIVAPDQFVQTNVVGTYTLLDAFYHHWVEQKRPASYRFLHVSTDEVYGSLSPDAPAFTESSPYAPNSPYSASKAGSDHLVRAYHRTYGLPTLTTHSSNNYGAYQYPEKLIPLMILNMLQGKPLPVYGDGQNVRDWVEVGDHCRALDTILSRGVPGEVYNLGSNIEIRNIDLVHQLCDLMDELAPYVPMRPTRQLITFVRDRPGHDFRYSLNSHKTETVLGWLPTQSFQEGLRQTVLWYLHHEDWWRSRLGTGSRKQP